VLADRLFGLIAEESLGAGMKGIEAASLPEEARLQTRGW